MRLIPAISIRVQRLETPQATPVIHLVLKALRTLDGFWVGNVSTLTPESPIPRAQTVQVKQCSSYHQRHRAEIVPITLLPHMAVVLDRRLVEMNKISIRNAI